MLEVQIFFNVVYMVSRGVLECSVEYCNHGATSCLNTERNRRDFNCHNQFRFILFSFIVGRVFANGPGDRGL